MHNFISRETVLSIFLNTANNNEKLDPLRAKKIFIRKKLGHTAVSAIKALLNRKFHTS